MPKGAGRPAHPTPPHTHPLFLVLHQYLLQGHLLAGLAVLCLKHLPAGGEGGPKRSLRGRFRRARPSPTRGGPERESRAGLGRVPQGTRLPHHAVTAAPSRVSTSFPLLLAPHPGVSRRSRSTHRLLSATPPCPPIKGLRLLPAGRLLQAPAGLRCGLARPGDKYASRWLPDQPGPGLGVPTSARRGAGSGGSRSLGAGVGGPALPEGALADFSELLIFGHLITKRALHRVVLLCHC